MNPRPAPTVAIGPDNNPIVTGHLNDASGNLVIRTIKYTSGGFFGGATEIWNTLDMGLGFGDSLTHQIVADGSSNAIVIGESENQDLDTDIYAGEIRCLDRTTRVRRDVSREFRDGRYRRWCRTRRQWGIRDYRHGVS